MPLIDLQVPDNNSNWRSQICIVGSGPAGATMAMELVRKGLDVCLLEQGNLELDAAYESVLPEGDLSDIQQVRWSQQLGGSSNVWAGRLVEMQPIDFKPRSWVADSGWPIQHSDLAPFYEKAKELIGVSLDRSERPDPFHGFDECEINTSVWKEPGFNFRPLLVDFAQTYQNFRVFINTHVSALVENEQGDCVQEVLIKGRNGATCKIKADVFIIAAGGIDTPRLLLNSTNRSSKGIGNTYDNVGRYFSTHPKGYIAMMQLEKRVSVNHSLFENPRKTALTYQKALGFKEEVQEAQKLLNHSLDLIPVYKYRANKAFEALFKKSYFEFTLVDRPGHTGPFLPGLFHIGIEAMRRVVRAPQFAKKFLLRGYFDQYPNRENRVLKTEAYDHYGDQKVKVEWRFTQQDQQSVLNHLSFLDQLLKKQNMGSIDFSTMMNIDKSWGLLNIHSHLMGTTRMGNDPKTSVTDPNGKVHGISNLYISGPSLFPTYGHSNPFLTIVALAFRQSEIVLSKHNPK